MTPPDDQREHASIVPRQTSSAAQSGAPADSPQDTKYEPVLAWLREHANLSTSAEKAAQRAALTYREPLPLALNRLGVVTDSDLQRAMMTVSGAPAATAAPDPEAIGEVNIGFLRLHRALPLKSETERFHLGLVDPLDDEAIRGVLFANGKDIDVSVLAAGAQRRLFTSLFESNATSWGTELAESDETRMEAALEFDRDAPVARKVASWLTAAVERRASDVHIEPRGSALVVRFRVDGQLETIAEEPLAAAPSVMARIKVLTDLDLGERRIAQDGRTSIVVAGRPIDLRVSVVPSVNGESAVLRILDRAEVKLTFEDLGFSPNERALLERAITWPHGLFLVTGPTGSGKTTTMYAALEAMRESGRKILTIEDPVEFHFDHVTQVQYAPKAGVTFPSAIRAFLRQDPDVIFVGEIRDGETARAAVQAALTGHLVLATLHAIDAPRSIPRLIDMGVEPFQLAACFRGALSQRLVRRVCGHCKGALLKNSPETTAPEPVSPRADPAISACPRCTGTGYAGRVASAESFAASQEIRGAIREQADLEAKVGSAMLSRLAKDAANKIAAGTTTREEAEQALSG